jgi:hypothetical protein
MATLFLTVLVLNAAQITYSTGPQGVHGMDMPIGPSKIPLQTATMDMDPEEYFTGLSGTMLSYGDMPLVRILGLASLSFSTNKQVYGPFGSPTTAQPFEAQGPVYAFHGAVTRGETTEILAAIGIWKVPPGEQRTEGDNVHIHVS